jgi:hypothetical protein
VKSEREVMGKSRGILKGSGMAVAVAVKSGVERVIRGRY